MTDFAFRKGKIRDAVHLNKLIDRAAGDEDLMKIKKQLEKQGMNTALPHFQGLKDDR